MTIQHKIEQFCAYFDEEVASILRLNLPPNPTSGHPGDSGRYQKTLCVTAIDTLAGLRFHGQAYPQLNRRNRERFTRFVREYASWDAAEYVSIPFLHDALVARRLISRPLGVHASQKLAQFSTEDGGSIDSFEVDEPYSTVRDLATSEAEEEILLEYRHVELLYRYRNSLVHESRQPGSAMEVFSGDGPYYHGYIGDVRFYLAYPRAMFTGILARSIARFRS